MANINQKYEILKQSLKEKKRVLVAFSGGVDSTFLLKVAHDVLGENALALTAHSVLVPKREYAEALSFTASEGIEHIVMPFDPFVIDGFKMNPSDRCYICKKALFSAIAAEAARRSVPFILDGSNADDKKDYRPGMRALKELSVVSPLKDAGLTKSEIRILSKELGLDTWEKPAYACLATRIPTNTEITPEALLIIEESEQFMFELGFKQIRVRCHGDLARIEVEESDFARIMDANVRQDVHNKLAGIGFAYVAIDILGYRMGSMNNV